MSDELRKALKIMKREIPNQNAPITYLHNGPTEGPFGALVTLDFVNEALEALGWDENKALAEHSHLEGDEDEDILPP